MARNSVNKKVSVEFNGDPKGIKKAAKEAKDAVANMGKDFKSTGDAIGKIGEEIAGQMGDVGSAIFDIAKSGGPIAMMTAAIGLVAKIWKTAKENMDLYLASADKLSVGPAAFESDVDKARKDTQRRAKGAISEGMAQVEYARRQLAIQKDLTTEQKDFLNSLIESGQLMQDQGKSLYSQVSAMSLQGTFTKNKLDWNVKYNALLQEQEKIHDAELVNQTRWEALENQIMEAKRVIGDADATAAEKKKAGLQAETAANQLIKEKIPFLDRQIANVKALSEMTMTQEVVEDKLASLERERVTVQKEFSADMIKVQKAQDRAEKSVERQVANEEKKFRLLKEQNLLTSEAVKLNEKLETSGFASVKNLQKAAGQRFYAGFKDMKPAGADELRGFGGLNAEEIEAAKESLQEMSPVVMGLTSTFENMFANMDQGFSGMIESMIESLKRFLTYIAAKAAVFGLLRLIAGPTSGLFTSLGGFSKFVFGGSYASGTNFAPGGLSLVGERGPELVNLPRGSQVIPMNKQKMTIEVVGKLRAKDIQFALARYNNELISNT